MRHRSRESERAKMVRVSGSSPPPSGIWTEKKKKKKKNIEYGDITVSKILYGRVLTRTELQYTSRHATDHHQAVLNLNGRDINGNQTPFNPLQGRLPTEHGRVLACTCAHVHLQHSTQLLQCNQFQPTAAEPSLKVTGSHALPPPAISPATQPTLNLPQSPASTSDSDH